MVKFFLLFLFPALAFAAVPPCRIGLVPGAFVNVSQSARFFLSPDDYFKDYKTYFQHHHCEIQQAQLPVDGSIEEQALSLAQQVGRWGGSDWILVAHSQGGLDARYALKSLHLQGVKALVTIGAPHAGTALAQWSLEQSEKGTLFYWALRVIGSYDLRALRFLGEMTPDFLKMHATSFEAVPGVRYLSAQGNCLTDCHKALRFLRWWRDLPPGDGIVSRDSQRFGEDLGEFDLDHISEVGADLSKSSERDRFLNKISRMLLPVQE